MADFDFVQAKMGSVTADNCPVTFDSTPAAGNTIVVFVAAYSETNPPTVTDNQSGNTYNLVVTADNTIYQFVAQNVNSTGTFTVTAHHTDTGNISAAISEFEGDLTFDQGAGNRLDSSATYDSGATGTTTVAAELLVGAAVIFEQNNASTPSGYTQRLAPTFDGSLLWFSIYSQVVAATSTYTLAGTNSTATATWAALATLYAAAPPAGGTWPGYIAPQGWF